MKKFLILLVIISNVCLSQNINIKGEIKDATTGEMLPYVNISIENKNIGTISNADGVFILSIPKEHASDSVIFSYIGYKKKYFLAKDLIENSFNTIELSSDAIILGEVTVIGLSPVEIIENVIDNIDKNYPTHEYQMRGFYRRILKEDNVLTEFSEMVIDILKPEYNKKQNEKFALVEGRYRADTASTINFVSGAANFVKTDILNLLKEFTTNKFKKTHILTIEDYIKVNGEIAYIISFKPRPDTKEVLDKGKMIIEKNSYALISFEKMTEPETLKFWRKSSDNSLFAQILAGIDVVGFHGNYYKINFYEQDNKWFLKSKIASATIDIHYNKLDKTYEQKAEEILVITNVYPELKNSDDYFSSPKTTPKKMIGDYNEEFWENYNIIQIENEIKNSFK